MKNLFLVSLACLSFVGCNDSYDYTPGAPNTGNGDGAPGYTHNELAVKFVDELNLDTNFEVKLAEDSTYQSNFIVIFDNSTKTFDAINIDNYDPAVDSAATYYNDNNSRGYYDLIYTAGRYVNDYDYVQLGTDIDGNDIYGYEENTSWVSDVWVDYYSGLKFEKVAATPKDLAKMKALVEVAEFEKTANFLNTEFGLSLNRGKEIARLTANWKKSSKKSMTDAEHDTFATELLGFSITRARQVGQAAITGDLSGIDALVTAAAQANNITPEHATKLMTKIFGL